MITNHRILDSLMYYLLWYSRKKPRLFVMARWLFDLAERGGDIYFPSFGLCIHAVHIVSLDVQSCISTGLPLCKFNLRYGVSLLQMITNHRILDSLMYYLLWYSRKKPRLFCHGPVALWDGDRSIGHFNFQDEGSSRATQVSWVRRRRR